MAQFVFRQGDLPKLDLQVDRGTDFKAWKTQWDAYCNLSGLKDQNQAMQVQALTLCFSRETRQPWLVSRQERQGQEYH